MVVGGDSGHGSLLVLGLRCKSRYTYAVRKARPQGGGRQMAPKTKPATKPRIPLSRERVLLAAVAFADEHGIGSLSMRKLGDVLGVEAMSLYNHLSSKDQLLDG